MAGESCWEGLPSIIIVEILSYLPLGERISATSTCKRWRWCLFYPSLWRSVKFSFTNGHRKAAKFLAINCAMFSRDITVEFDAGNRQDLKECLKCIETLGQNHYLEKFALKPSSCHVDWIELGDHAHQRFVLAMTSILKSARCLSHLSFGCIDVSDFNDEIVQILADNQYHSLESVHLSSIKEDPDNYSFLEFPSKCFQNLRKLRILGLDYDNLTNELLECFTKSQHAGLEKLLINVHGYGVDSTKLSDTTWKNLVQYSPALEVTLNLLHSVDGVTHLLDILRPHLPLAHFRMLFCQNLNTSAILHMSQHNCNTLKSVFIVDDVLEDGPASYDSAGGNEDPFVMLAWKCANLREFTMIGYEMLDEDLIAIARLRGSQLTIYDIPEICISTVVTDDNHFGIENIDGMTDELVKKISESLERDWKPLQDNELHPSVLDIQADTETAYLPKLLKEQEWT